MKLDAFFIICFVLQYGLIDVHFIEPEFGLTMSIIPALTILMVLGVYFVRKEQKLLMILVVVSEPSFFHLENRLPSFIY